MGCSQLHIYKAGYTGYHYMATPDIDHTCYYYMATPDRHVIQVFILWLHPIGHTCYHYMATPDHQVIQVIIL